MIGVRGIGAMYQGMMFPPDGDIIPMIVDRFIDVAHVNRAAGLRGDGMLNFPRGIWGWTALQRVEVPTTELPGIEMPPPFMPPVSPDTEIEDDRPGPETPDPLEEMDLPPLWLPWRKRIDRPQA